MNTCATMSPIITFRPLNNFGDKSKVNTPPLGTPNLHP